MQGPVTSAEIKQLAATGGLQPHDLLWPEGTDSRLAVEALAAIPFPAPAAAAPGQPTKKSPSGPAPDWLADIQKTEQAGAGSLASGRKAIPNWLEDVRRAEGIPPPQPGPVPGTGENGPPVARTVLPAEAPLSNRIIDWLEEIRQHQLAMAKKPGGPGPAPASPAEPAAQ
jgi:hypothetical protein